MDILNEISLFLQTSVQMGTHILFAIVGGIICEKVGNMNLGIEGMMLMGAAVGFQVACATPDLPDWSARLSTRSSRSRCAETRSLPDWY